MSAPAELPTLRPPDVVIVVLNWNGRDDTLACLASLAAADLGGARVVVVDNGSRDDSVAAVRAAHPAVEVLALERNRGYAGGNNAGLRHALAAGAGAVLLLNNDTRPHADFLAPLLWALNAEPFAAAVCSAIHRLDRPELLDVAYGALRVVDPDAVKILGVNALPSEGFAERTEIEIAIGCSLLLRASALRDIGLFDEAYFAYHEDVDWSLRAHRRHWKLLYEPMSRVLHRGSGSTATARPLRPPDGLSALPNAEPLPWNPVRTYLGARNLVRLLRTYASPRERFAFARATLRHLPLAYLAVVYDREGWLRLGRWGWRDALRAGVGRDPLWRAAPRAHRAGYLAQYVAHVRGLWDGLLDRPLPLARLGLE